MMESEHREGRMKRERVIRRKAKEEEKGEENDEEKKEFTAD